MPRARAARWRCTRKSFAAWLTILVIALIWLHYSAGRLHLGFGEQAYAHPFSGNRPIFGMLGDEIASPLGSILTQGCDGTGASETIDGDCLCPEGTTCFDRNALGCLGSSIGRPQSRFHANCTGCRCVAIAHGLANETRVDVGHPDAPQLLKCNPSTTYTNQPIPELEDNAPRPPARDGEFDIHSKAPDILPGADATHLHGLLGHFPNGSCCILRPVRLPKKMAHKERKDAHRGFAFNSRTSESLNVDRPQKDVRSKGCRRKHETYPCMLPQASVVIVFHNEHFVTLIRSIHTVLNHSPPHLLREVILVDDASAPDKERFYERHWSRLQDELVEYCKGLPKVRIARLTQRRGLMVARMEGVWRSTAEIVVFLDSHIEATPGWLEPLLARIAEDRRRVVVPSIDTIENDNFKYHTGGLGVLSFTWSLGQNPVHRPDNDEAARSPVMAGGLFAADRAHFLHLGGYDPEMRLYGGEEMEIGFRTWQCGGQIEHLPCSHVGHIFRQGNFWQGQVYRVPMEDIIRNKLRAAEIWMDEYKQLVQKASYSLPPGMSLEPLRSRRELRKKLGCKPFQWYLQNIATDVKVPRLNATPGKGSLMNIITGGCVDTLGQGELEGDVGVYPCHGQGGTQLLSMDVQKGHIVLSDGRFCMAGHAKYAKFRLCGDGVDVTWHWSPLSKSMRGVGTLSGGEKGKCLAAYPTPTKKSPFSLGVDHCNGSPAQMWGWL